MTIEEWSRGQKMLERMRGLNGLKDELTFLRQSNRTLWIHAGESHAEVMPVPSELRVRLLDMLDGYVEREKKNAEEEFNNL